MSSTAATEPEPWLRGPVPGIAPLLQPVAHALLQAVEDVRRVVTPLDRDALWARPGGAASVGFHVRHAAGALDRLFTYARGDTRDGSVANEFIDLAPRGGLTVAHLR